MKVAILIACLVISASAEPQKTIQKSEKLQFTPADAQVYSGQVVPQYVAGKETVDQVIAGNIAVPQVVSSYDQVIPAYYAGAQPVVPSVIGGPQYVYPGQSYYSTGRTTATTLPTGTVYEHHGSAHVGHLASAVHVKRPGQYVSGNIPSYSTAYTVGQQVPSHHLPAGIWSQTYQNGHLQYINGQPAQYVNGNWYYVNSVNPLVNQYSSVYTNLRGQVIPGTYSNVPVVNKVWAAPGTTQYTQSVVGYRPVQESKWYTKTNTQQVASPFWQQGTQQQWSAQSPLPAAAGTKHHAVQKPDAEEKEW